MVTDLLGICQNEKLDVLLCNRNSSMSLFLKNLSTSFFRAVVSSRPVFNKATSLFASIAINANKHQRLPINTIGTAHARSICFGSPFQRNDFLRKFKLLSSRTYSKDAKKSPNECDEASKNKTPDKTKKDSSKSPQYFCEDLRKSAAKAKTPDKTKKPSKGASNVKLSAKGIKCAVEKEGILCYIDCSELVGNKNDSKDKPKGSKQSKSEGEVCKKPSKKDLKKSKTVGDVSRKATAKKPATAPPKKKKKKRKLIPDEDADVKAMTGTWVSKNCLKFDFTCGGKVVKAGTEPVKLEDCDEEELEAQAEEECYMPSKSEGAPDQSPLKKCIQQCKKNVEHKNMSTKSGSYDDECEEKPKRKSKKHKKKKKKKTPSKKKDDDCKPCSSKKALSKGKGKKKTAAAAAAAKKEEEESKAFDTIEELTKQLCECKRSLAKLKAEFDGTAGECQPAPKLDKKLPKPKKQDKDVVSCSKNLLQSVCDGIKANKSAPSVAKSKSVKDVKKSKSADCKQSKEDDEKPKKKVSDFCKGKEKGETKDKCSDRVSATVKANQKPKRSPPCKYEDAKKKKKDECKPAKAKDECENEAEAKKAKDDECEDEKKSARKQAKEERLRKLLCANDSRKQAAKDKSKQLKDPEPEEYCTEPKKKKPEPEKEKPKIKTACELEKSGKRTKRRMICTDDPDRNPKHEPKGNRCLEEFGKSQKKPKEICAKPKPKKSDDCKPKEKKSKSDSCKPAEKKPSKSKSDTCKPLEKKPSKSKSDICKPSDKKSSKPKSDPCKPSKSKSDTGKPSGKKASKSDPCKSLEKKPSKSKSDTCKPSDKKSSKPKSDPCKPSKSKSDTGKPSGKKASKSKSDPCKSLEKKPSKSKSDPCKKKPSKSKSDTSKSLKKKKSKSQSSICTTPKTKPLCKPKIAEAGKKKTKFPEYCPSGKDEPKSSKSLPPDQSPIMQCIALCKKKMKANKPQEGKGVPPRDKKPCTTDKKVFKKLVEFTEETDKCKKPKGEDRDPCKEDKKVSKKAKSEETDKCEESKDDEVKQFVPCKTEEIKPGIRKGEGDDKTKVECPPKKKKSKIPDCPPESKPKEKKKEKKEAKKKEAKETKEAKDEEVKVEQNEAKCVKFPFSCKEECKEEIEECQEEKEECQEEKEECEEEKKPLCECIEEKDPCEDTKKKKKKQEDDCD